MSFLRKQESRKKTRLDSSLRWNDRLPYHGILAYYPINYLMVIKKLDRCSIFPKTAKV